MKTIRQNKTTLPPSHPHRFSSHLPRQPKVDAKKCNKMKLESLFKIYRSNEIVRLVCKGDLTLEIEKQPQKFMTTGHKKLYRDNVYIKPGTSQVLAQTLAEKLVHPSATYLFSAKLYPQEEVKQFRTSNSDSKNSFLSRTSTQKELKPFLPSKKTTFKPSFQPKTMSDIPQENTDLMSKRCLSQRNMAHDWSGQKKQDEMFTVEELKESMQSEPRESFKTGKDKENMGYRANEEYLERPKFFMETLGPVSFAQDPEPQEKIAQLITTQLLTPLQACPYPETKEIFIKKSLKQAIENPPDIKVSAPIQPGFSLTSQLRKGLIQGGVSASQSLSFKIAGDQSIEDQKLRKQESHIEELSSIASNPREDPFQKQTEQKQLDSIKGEIQDLNHCFAKKSEGQVQRVNLGALGQQREAGAEECVQISQNNKDNPMSVRYNVRFLSSRNKGTEVVRLSPLRFRKKEEMVQQLVNARLVPKESDSILIS